MKTLLLLRWSLRVLVLVLLPTFVSAQNYNYFAGSFAGASNTTGSFNDFVGTNAGNANTVGSYNSFVGSESGLNTTTESNNAFVGYRAGYANTTGKHNTFVGSQAGYSTTTGYDNLFFGMQVGNKNTIGYANAFVGFSAGYNNTTGYSNTCFGSQAGYAITAAGRNSFFGNFAGQNTTTGSENVFLGRSAGATNVTGYFNVSIGNFSGPSLTNLQNAIAIGYRATVSKSNSLVLGSINGVNSATADTKVGIKTTAPAYDLHVNGTAAKPGGGSWTVASDQRLKQDIAEFKDGLEMVEKIRPVWFRYNGKADLPTDQKYVGVIAQQMQKIAPYMIGEFVYQDSTGRQEKYLDYDANAVTYMLVNAVRQIDEKYARQLREKGAQVSALQQENQQIRNELAELENLKQELATIKQLLLGLNKPTDTASEKSPLRAKLWQNEPNPYDQTTIIKFQLPDWALSAFIKVYATTGRELHSFDITGQRQGQVSISSGLLPAGTYVYHLLVDGKSVDAKKLVQYR